MFGCPCYTCRYRILMSTIAVMTAFRSGAVMGFVLAGNGLLVLYLIIVVYKRVRDLPLEADVP